MLTPGDYNKKVEGVTIAPKYRKIPIFASSSAFP
jgi:hypothetical protein